MAGRPEDRLLTIPNVISVIRLLMVPVFLYLLFGKDDRWSAGWLLGGVSATDWVDGWIARRFNQGSNFGKVFDPIADRILLIVGIVSIIISGAVPGWVAVLALIREGAVALMTVVLYLAGARRIDVHWFGKAGTTGLMVAFPSFLLASSTNPSRFVFLTLAWWGIGGGLSMGYYSFVDYFPEVRRSLRERSAATTTTENVATNSTRVSRHERTF